MRWFTTYAGYDWTPNKGYSDLFTSYVRSVRTHFQLVKTVRAGVEVAKGIWIPYKVQGEDVQVILDRFEWKHYDESDGVFFVMKLRVAKKQRQGFLDLFSNRASPMVIIFDEVINVYFDRSFPSSPPLFKVMNRAFMDLEDQHGHHIFKNGMLCIMANSSDWDPAKHDILRAINVVVDWVVLHYNNWGSDPERW